MNAHDFSFRRIDGGHLPLADLKGKVILLVNTASACGLTRQYAGLEELSRAYQERGLVVLGVPSNDFGGQEPGSEAEIKTFCETKFGVSFPMTAKEKVVGAAAHPFYKWASEQLGSEAAPKWNFHKYLIAPDGTLAASFASTTPPTADEILAAIDTTLKGARP